MNDTISMLWNDLKRRGVVQANSPPAIEQSSPWYIRVMLGVSGWLAAAFLLGFVAIGLQFIIENKIASIMAGVLAMATAYIIFGRSSSDFADQFGLVLSLVGQALFLWGIVGWLDFRGSSPWLICSALQIIVIGIMASFIQRVIAGYLAIITLSVACSFHGVFSAAAIFPAFCVAVFWLNEYHWGRTGTFLRPAMYGVTLSLLQLKGQIFFGDGLGFFTARGSELQRVLPQWTDELVAGLLLVAVVAMLIRRRNAAWTDRSMITAIPATAAVVVASFEASGIATGLMVVLLGFANGNRIVLGLGIASLLFYISAFYYTLEATLLTKAIVLAVTGITLLLARFAVLTWMFEGEERV